MAIQHVNLSEDSQCGFCGSEVKQGFSVCKNCGAVYGYKEPFANDNTGTRNGCFLVFIIFVLFAIGGLIGAVTGLEPLAFIFWIFGLFIIVMIYLKIKEKYKKDLAWWR